MEFQKRRLNFSLSVRGRGCHLEAALFRQHGRLLVLCSEQPEQSFNPGAGFAGGPRDGDLFLVSTVRSNRSLSKRRLEKQRGRQRERERVIRGCFHVLFDFFVNSRTDPFCLALQLQALRLRRPALRSERDSLSLLLFFSLCVIVFIVFLMLVLCLILLSLTMHSHNAVRRGDTKGRGN